VASAKFEVIQRQWRTDGLPDLAGGQWGGTRASRSGRREVTVSWALIQSTAWGRRRSRSPIRPTTPRN